MNLTSRIGTLLARPLEFVEDHLREPRGAFGRLLGHAMAWQHRSLTEWTLSRMGVGPADHVVDLGCGGGMAIKLLAEMAPDGFVAGLDYAEAMVEQAGRRNATAVAQGRVAISRGNALALPYADNTFDRACAIETLYFWPNPITGLREAHRVLKPGGRIAVTLEMSKECAGQSSAFRRRLSQRYATRAARRGQLVCSGNELAAMLRQVGFREVSYVTEPDRSLGWLCALGEK